MREFLLNVVCSFPFELVSFRELERSSRIKGRGSGIELKIQDNYYRLWLTSRWRKTLLCETTYGNRQFTVLLELKVRNQVINEGKKKSGLKHGKLLLCQN